MQETNPNAPSQPVAESPQDTVSRKLYTRPAKVMKTDSKRSGGEDCEVLDLTLPDDSEHDKGEQTALTPKGESKNKGEPTLMEATAQKGKDKANGNPVLCL